MMSTGMRTFVSLGSEKSQVSSFVPQKFPSAHVCKQRKNKFLVRKYPDQVGPCG